MSLTVVKVSDLVSRVNTFLQKCVNLSGCMIEGELSNVRNVRGHYYFDLKDDKGQISCVMWVSHTYGLDFKPENGLSVLCAGSIAVYEARGALQLVVTDMRQTGIGALYIELEKRRKKLQAEGYFEASHKKQKPAWIESIGLVTGNNTAALEDVKKTIFTRWPMLKVTLYPALVQGANAPAEIAAALKKADTAGHDAILLVRGGGGIEDLFCFNDEEIVKTLYGMKTYTVTGIGHEIDTTLADLAADHRAVTPTAAAQWVTPDQRQVRADILNARKQMIHLAKNLFARASQNYLNLQSAPVLASPQNWILSRKQNAEVLIASLKRLELSYFQAKSSELNNMEQALKNAGKEYEAFQKNALNNLASSLLIHSPKAGMQVAEGKIEVLKEQMADRKSVV